MRQTLISGTVLSLIFLILPNAFAENSYNLTVDEHSFDLRYDFDGDVIAIAVDQELTSLLIGIKNTKDSLFSISFDCSSPSKLNLSFLLSLNFLIISSFIFKLLLD